MVDGESLKSALRSGVIGGAVLDVWENEPYIDCELMELVYLATPHIAGYSLDGKVNGTTMIYTQICQWVNIKPIWNPDQQLPLTDHPMIDIDASGRKDEDVLREAVFKVYPIQRDDLTMRDLLKKPGETRGYAFDMLRKSYPVRREFSLSTICLNGASEQLKTRLMGITFQVEREYEGNSQRNQKSINNTIGILSLINFF